MEEPPRKPDQLDALLARKRLSGPEYDFIAARVLDGVSRGARIRRVALYAAPALAAALVIAIVLPGSDGLRAKGAHTRAPALEIACAIGGASSCPRGAVLTFRVEDAIEGGYLHAWAEPGAGGERVWYFSGPEAVPVEAGRGLHVLRRGARIVAGQAPGRYAVRLVLARERLDREALLDRPRAVLADVTVPLEVTP
jgi:hypothetical protein